MQEFSKNQEQIRDIQNDYKSKNPNYDILCFELSKAQQKLSDLKVHICKRNNFIEQLKECQDRIRTYLLEA